MVASSGYTGEYLNPMDLEIDIPKCKTVILPDALKYVVESSLEVLSIGFLSEMKNRCE